MLAVTPVLRRSSAKCRTFMGRGLIADITEMAKPYWQG